MKLKNEWRNSFEISQVLSLWNRSFLVNKNYAISYKQLSNLFVKLVDLDKKMKSGNMIWSEDNDFLFEIENVLIKTLN
jgi:hypothetical protein